LKTVYRDEVERLDCGSIDTIGKERFTSLCKPARNRAFTKRNIQTGWAAIGLFPYIRERVSRDTPKPPAPLPVLGAGETEVFSYAQDEVSQLSVKPKTPAIAEALIRFYILTKEGAYA
jgi:hypothetical protein